MAPSSPLLMEVELTEPRAELLQLIEPAANSASVDAEETVDEYGDDDDDDDDDQLGEYVIADLKIALYDARFAIPLTIAMSLVAAYYLLVSPYRQTSPAFDTSAVEAIGLLRPVLSEVEQLSIRKITSGAETHFWLPLPSNDIVTLKYHRSATNDGVHQPPSFFYEGVLFGITTENSHNLMYTGQSKSDLKDLRDEFGNMFPQPTAILDRTSTYNETAWYESGYAVYFSFDDLRKKGKLSSDHQQPWKRVLDDVLVVARKFKQSYITLWYPSTYGFSDEGSNPHKFKSLIQQVVPTRTGLGSVKSKAVVWMAKVNHSTPVRKDRLYRKAWTYDDHWSAYLYRDEDRARERKKLEELLEYHKNVTVVDELLKQNWDF